MLRIIGGTHRGRRLRFTGAAEIRPTPDRVRETLFNWLGARVAGARCLDLFAGSGALGLEALSRGAAHVTFVERDAAAARDLEALLADWRLAGATVARVDARSFLERPAACAAAPFDIVFLDPPYGTGLLEAAAARLESPAWLARGALIYVEAAGREPLPTLPGAWTVLRTGRAGEVGYHLLERTATEAGP